MATWESGVVIRKTLTISAFMNELESKPRKGSCITLFDVCTKQANMKKRIARNGVPWCCTSICPRIVLLSFRKKFKPATGKGNISIFSHVLFPRESRRAPTLAQAQRTRDPFHKLHKTTGQFRKWVFFSTEHIKMGARTYLGLWGSGQPGQEGVTWSEAISSSFEFVDTHGGKTQNVFIWKLEVKKFEEFVKT